MKISALQDGRDGVAISGEVDIYSINEFKEPIRALIEAGKKTLYLDFSDMEYIDSTGIGVLIELRQQSMAGDQEIILVNPKRSINKLFSMTGVDKIFQIVGE